MVRKDVLLRRTNIKKIILRDIPGLVIGKGLIIFLVVIVCSQGFMRPLVGNRKEKLIWSHSKYVSSKIESYYMSMLGVGTLAKMLNQAFNW